MTEFLITLLKSLLAYLPFALFLWIDSKANVRRRDRSIQFLLPVLSLVYCAAAMFLVNDLNEKVSRLLLAIPELVKDVPVLAALVAPFLDVRIELIVFYVLNVLLLIGHIILKLMSLPLLRAVCKAGGLADEARELCYEHDPLSGAWMLKKNCAQGRTFLKTLFLAAACISAAVGRVAVKLYLDERMTALFYPVFGVIVLGELYFFFNGLIPGELEEDISAEGEKPQRFCNFAPLRGVLRKLFPDKLAAENTTMGTSLLDEKEDSGLSGRMKTGDAIADAYYAYMYKQQRAGLQVDPGYLASGLNLARGKSVLFNNPFYYDLIPYAFYAMNRNLLRHRKVLVILGRHGVEQDIETWLDRGLSAVTNIPGMWNIGVLTDSEQELDVGIVTRSGVHELDLHAQNEEFFFNVGMVVLVEPSRLLTTAQVGLNSIIRRCRKEDVTYCSTDRNCDGLVDALSHLLMTNITEVSATNRHQGTCSYMCWETDGENLQHRLLPNISHYLGVGTELSFVALKNQVEKSVWYGGEAFPVQDMHWIARQYYYDLLRYADLPANQDEMDRCFAVSYNMWNEPVRENGYFVVEDESRNMFEIKREFATRATGQSFINIISPQYLLHDYMAENEGLFDTDPKAIPAIVADYAGTPRNVALRLFLRMSLGDITKRELANELQLIGIGGEDPVAQAWSLLCRVGQAETNENGEELFVFERSGGKYVFRQSETIQTVRKYSVRTGEIDDFVQIIDSTFRDVLLSDLKNARYVSEEENGEQKYLGSELVGHIFQRYLPGQFFTFEGKYYEMLRMTPDGRVVLRRAAEHITGRSFYRQLRTYRIHRVEDSEEMGSCRCVGGMRITRQFADLSVETPGYWQMQSYQDFETGRKVELNGVPARSYGRKQILCVEFDTGEEPVDEKVCQTVTLLLNEVFRTVFSENSEYIVALCAGEFERPMTYSLVGTEGFEPKRGCIYFVEDSQLDLGLLIAVERNLQRLFEIVCDYLDWHLGAVQQSEAKRWEKRREETSTDDDTGTEEGPAPNEPARRKGLFARIREWFAKLFKRKKKEPAPAEPQPENDENSVEDTAPPEEPPAEDTAADDAAPAAENEEQEAAGGETAQEDASGSGEAEPDEAGADRTEEAQDEPSAGGETAPSDGELVSCSVSAAEPGVTAEAESAGDEEPSEEGETPENEDGGSEDDGSGQETFEFEKPESTHASPIPERKPYHERCYLFYGGSEVPDGLDLSKTLSFLEQFGFGDRELAQARRGRDIASRIADGYDPNRPGTHYCDFCGVELVGTEYDVLKDGRESCTSCSRTAVRTEAEFRSIYHELMKNMEVFFGMHINVPVKIRMINARKLHREWGTNYVPTSNHDARILGFASGRKGYSIQVENGAPRVRTTMTMAHEMTHIWQYLNWDFAKLTQKYGKEGMRDIMEGMAMWSEIQYTYLIGETGAAKREEILTRLREDEYGRGFRKYVEKYPISPTTHLEGPTPFDSRGGDPF